MLGGYYAITTWLPTYLKTVRHLSVFNTSGYLIVLIVGSFTGYIVGAILCDKIGRRASFVLFAIGSFVLGMVYTMLPITDGMMLALGFPLGIVVQGIFAGVGALSVGAVSEFDPRLGARLLLQPGPRSRLVLSDPGGYTVANHDAC